MAGASHRLEAVRVQLHGGEVGVDVLDVHLILWRGG